MAKHPLFGKIETVYISGNLMLMIKGAAAETSITESV
jgi:hypothetical protein